MAGGQKPRRLFDSRVDKKLMEGKRNPGNKSSANDKDGVNRKPHVRKLKRESGETREHKPHGRIKATHHNTKLGNGTLVINMRCP